MQQEYEKTRDTAILYEIDMVRVEVWCFGSQATGIL
jgi:hypothetical protein